VIRAVFGCCLVAVSLTGIACSDTQPTACPAVTAAHPRPTPGDTTIHVGQSFTLVLQSIVFPSIAPCDGAVTIVPTRWATADTNVISLDTLTGRVTGRSIGDAHISPSGEAQPPTAVVHVR
jgi:hypothetical protein